MFRITRNRALIAGLAVAVGASSLTGMALARTDGYGADPAARGDALAVGPRRLHRSRQDL